MQLFACGLYLLKQIYTFWSSIFRMLLQTPTQQLAKSLTISTTGSIRVQDDSIVCICIANFCQKCWAYILVDHREHLMCHTWYNIDCALEFGCRRADDETRRHTQALEEAHSPSRGVPPHLSWFANICPECNWPFQLKAQYGTTSILFMQSKSTFFAWMFGLHLMV